MIRISMLDSKIKRVLYIFNLCLNIYLLILFSIFAILNIVWLELCISSIKYSNYKHKIDRLNMEYISLSNFTAIDYKKI